MRTLFVQGTKGLLVVIRGSVRYSYNRKVLPVDSVPVGTQARYLAKHEHLPTRLQKPLCSVEQHVRLLLKLAVDLLPAKIKSYSVIGTCALPIKP